MNQAYLPVRGDLVSLEDLTFPKALELARFSESEVNPFSRLVECRASPEEQVVVMEVDVELPQRPAHDIRRQERVAVVFFSGDEVQPEVLALRPDFPLVPHLNQRSAEFPRSLCLYDRPYHEIRLHQTAAVFVEDIRNWLAQTAKGQLHGEDQPLEPLLFNPKWDIVLPENLMFGESSGTPQWLTVRIVQREGDMWTFITSHAEVPNSHQQTGPRWVALVVSCPPQSHGIIRHMPQTVAELHELIAASGLDLIAFLRQALKDWMQGQKEEFQRMLETRLILIVRLPKTRKPGGKVETVEVRAFAIPSTIKDVGVEIGVWGLNQGKPGLLLEYDNTKRGTGTSLIPLNPRPAFSRLLAAMVNGLREPWQVRVTATGVGALGSQVVSNLVRAGFGQWTLVDDDVLLPHNLGRHALDGFALGFSKATALAEVLNGIIEGEKIARGIVADVLRPGENSQSLESDLSEAEIILDMSASVPVARHLCRDVASGGRRISLFLNPSGTALTMLAEDADRRIPLDALEMQFYREIAVNPRLSGFLASPERSRIGQTCRDLSVQIPQDLVALYAAIGSHSIREAIATDHARISTWQVEQQGYTVSAMQIDPAEPREERVGNWTVYTDARLLDKLTELRRERLPKETGGILIGAYDIGRKILYIVEAVPSPPDSEEWPTAYIRGSRGLTQRVQDISKATDGMLQYIGEWHSHPDGSSVSPSPADLKVLNWLGEIMDQDGVPGVVAIVGDERRLTLLLGGLAAT